MTKSPKLYFSDTALAAYLLGIHDAEILIKGPSFGNLFETAVMADFFKRYLHHGQKPAVYFLRTADGLEVDGVLEAEQKLHLFEIKSVQTLQPKYAHPLSRWCEYIKDTRGVAGVIGAQDSVVPLSRGIKGIPWRALSR